MNTIPEPTLIKNIRVFDGTTFLAAPHDVSIADGRISALSPSGSAPLPEHGTILDGTGHTLTPGLIDAHVHLMTSSGTALSQLSEPFSLQFFEAAAAMKATLQAGVTTVRDAGGADFGVKVAQERGITIGPAIKLSISILSQTGGHGDGWLRDGVHQPMVGEHPGRPSGVGDGADGMRATARRMFRAGADQIKICTTGGVLSPYDDPRHSQLTLPEISAIVEEAQMRGSYVMAHAQGTPGIISAIEAGVRSIEHGIYLDRRAADMMAARACFSCRRFRHHCR